jgi:hypothetical protein
MNKSYVAMARRHFYITCDRLLYLMVTHARYSTCVRLYVCYAIQEHSEYTKSACAKCAVSQVQITPCQSP